MDIRPDVHILESLRAATVNYPVLLGEAVDNSIDAGASKVAITLANEMVSIADDGSGITQNRVTSLVRLGEHGPMSTTTLGRYGIGIKHHAVNAGNEFKVRSVSADGLMTLMVDWGQILRSKTWEIDDAEWSIAPPGMTHGTQVVISKLLHNLPSKAVMDRARSELAQRFYPALASGRTISLNGIAIPLLEEPRLTNIVEAELTFPEGRLATVRAGMLADPKTTSRLRQVQVSYGHRVIMPTSDFGCGDHTGTKAMFARVHLSGGWGLGRFKDELVDAHCDALAEAVGEVLEPLLKLCEARSCSVELEEITRRINEALPPEMVPVRPIKVVDRQRSSEAAQRAKHGRAIFGDESPTGPARRPSGARSRLIIELAEQSIDEDGYGGVTFGKSRRDCDRVRLTKDHPDIAAVMRLRDQDLAARILCMTALFLYDHERITTERQPDMLARSFGVRISELMARQNMRGEEAA